MSFTGCESVSGNLISKLTIKSPLRVGSFGRGRPYPWIRLTVFGLITSEV